MTSAGRGARIAPAVSSSAWPRRALLSLTALSLVASAFSGSAYAATSAELRADTGSAASRSAKLTAVSDSQGDEGASSNDVNDPSSTPERPADSQPLAPRAGGTRTRGSPHRRAAEKRLPVNPRAPRPMAPKAWQRNSPFPNPKPPRSLLRLQMRRESNWRSRPKPRGTRA